MPKSVTTPIIPLIGCLSINAAEVKPRNIPSQNLLLVGLEYSALIV
jgi:hypothetical protein